LKRVKKRPASVLGQFGKEELPWQGFFPGTP